MNLSHNTSSLQSLKLSFSESAFNVLVLLLLFIFNSSSAVSSLIVASVCP